MLCSNRLGMKDLRNLCSMFHDGFHSIRKWKNLIAVVAMKSLARNMLCRILELVNLHWVVTQDRSCYTIGIIGHGRQEMPGI